MTNDCICSNVPRIWRLAGVTRTVRLTVTKDGSPYDFTGLQTVLRIDRDNSDFHYEPQFTVDGEDNNIIVFAWAADKQPLGDYTIEVAVTDGSGNKDRVNWHGATGVRLVEYSNLVKGEDAAGVESDSELGLDGIFTMNGTGMSAYEEWLADGNEGSLHDYILWMQGPAREAAEEAEAQMAVIQSQADEDHTRAESDHTRAGNDHSTAASDHTTAAADHTRAGVDHTRAEEDHSRAISDHTRAAQDHTSAVGDHMTAGQDHLRAEADHTTASTDHTKAGQDSTRAGSDHDIAVADHAQAEADHTRAEGDHTTAAADHTTAAADHTTAASDHTTAAADHTQATADHAVMAGYDTRLTNVETDVTQLGQEVKGTIVDQNYEVDNNNKRTQNYTLSSGTKIVIKVTRTGGSGSTYNAYWIKAGGNEAIFTGMDYGYVSDVLTVPDDATGVSIFMNGVATGNTRNVKIYDTSLPAYLTETTPKLDARVATEEEKTATLEGKVSTLEGKAINFTGTDGTNLGAAGFVPAPATTDKDKFLNANGTWVRSDGYFYNENVAVNNNNQRSKSFLLAPGSKIVVRVSVVSGTSSTMNLYWIKSGGNETIISGYPMGYITNVLTVPNDATGLQVFMNPAATGNVNKVEIWDASRAEYLSTKIGNEGLVYLANRKVLSKSLDVTTLNEAITVLSDNECLLTPLRGDIFAIITGTARVKTDAGIRFWESEDSSSPSVSILGAVLKDGRKIYKIFSSAELKRVDIVADSFETGGSLEITVFSLDSSVEKFDAPLYGRNIMCFGDSLTAFRMSAESKRYTNYLAELSQANVYNAGIGGTRLAQRETPSTTPSDNQACVAAFDIVSLVTAWATNNYDVQDAAIASGYLTEDQQSEYGTKLSMLKANPINNYDIVTIFGGTNDYTGGSTIGTADAENTDKGTVYGAINAMVSALLTAKPTLKIYFFSPIIRMFQSTVSLATSSDVYVPSSAPGGKTLPQFCEVIADAVKLNHCPFCDWYWSLGWNMYNFTEYFGTDFTHPYNGFNVLADKMYKFLLSK